MFSFWMLLLQKERLSEVGFLQGIFFPFVIMEMANGCGLRELLEWFGGWRGKWFWEFLSWRWFSLPSLEGRHLWCLVLGFSCPGVWCCCEVSPEHLSVRSLLAGELGLPQQHLPLLGEIPTICVGVSKGKDQAITSSFLSLSGESTSQLLVDWNLARAPHTWEHRETEQSHQHPLPAVVTTPKRENAWQVGEGCYWVGFFLIVVSLCCLSAFMHTHTRTYIHTSIF